MTNEERAAYIAEHANECCSRSDGYEEDVKKTALTLLDEAVDAERERCGAIIDAARFEEVDRDWRSLRAMVDSGQSILQIKMLDADPNT